MLNHFYTKVEEVIDTEDAINKMLYIQNTGSFFFGGI